MFSGALDRVKGSNHVLDGSKRSNLVLDRLKCDQDSSELRFRGREEERKVGGIRYEARAD